MIATSIINPYGYDPKKGGGGSGIEFGEIDENRAEKEAQLYFGRRKREASIWTAPSENATAFSKTNVSSWVMYGSNARRAILLKGVAHPEIISGVEAEVDGYTATLTDKTNMSAPYHVTFQGNINGNNIVVYLETDSKGQEYTALKDIRLTISSSVFKGHFELKSIVLNNGTKIGAENTDDAGLYVSRNTRTASDGKDIVLDRMNATEVLYLDDWKERERLTGYYKDYGNRFRMKEAIAAGTRLVLLMRRDRNHLTFEEEMGHSGYTYKNTAFSDETLKAVPTGNLRYYIQDPNGTRYLSGNIQLSLDQSNNWSGGSDEVVAGNSVRCAVGNTVYLDLASNGKLPDGYRIGIYSLELGGQAVSDNPDIYFGSAVSVGNGEFFLESTVFPNRESAVWMSKFLNSAPNVFGKNFDMPVLYFDENRNLWKFNPAMGSEFRMVTEYEFNELAARVTALENRG